MQKYKTVKEVAAHFGKSERTVRHWISIGTIPRGQIKWKSKDWALSPGVIEYLEKQLQPK